MRKYSQKFPAFGGKIFPDFQKNIDREIFLEFQVVSIDRSWTAEQIQKYYRPYPSRVFMIPCQQGTFLEQIFRWEHVGEPAEHCY